MSLIVQAYRRDPETGKMTELDTEPVPPCNEMAGVDALRFRVYGSAAVKNLGLTLLPSLAKDEVYAEGDDLDRLEAEIDLLTHNLSAVAASTEVDEEGLRFRLDNMREAVRLARQVGGGAGGVYIG